MFVTYIYVTHRNIDNIHKAITRIKSLSGKVLAITATKSSPHSEHTIINIYHIYFNNISKGDPTNRRKRKQEVSSAFKLGMDNYKRLRIT